MALKKLTFDMVEILKRVESDKEKVRQIRQAFNNDFAKTEFGNMVIDTIVDRTLNGKDKDGNSFHKYSKSYIKSDNFAIFGKSSRQVNLKLSGEMQASIEVVNTSQRGVTIWIQDSEQRDKADGHVHGNPATGLPIRDFWGVSKEEENKIMKEFIRKMSSNILFEIPEAPDIISEQVISGLVGQQQLDIELDDLI